MEKENFVICSKQDLVQVIKEQLQNVLQNFNVKGLSVNKTETNKEYIPRLDLARKLNISTVTLDKWVKNSVIPAPVKIGGRIYFDQEEVWKAISQK